MTVKEYLFQIRDADETIRWKHEELERLRAQAEGYQCEIKERVKSSVASDALAETVAKIIDLEDEYSEDVQRAIKMRARIIDEIDRINDITLRKILILRYVEFKTWEKIAVEIDHSFRHTTRLHGQALKKIKDVLECPTLSVI